MNGSMVVRLLGDGELGYVRGVVGCGCCCVGNVVVYGIFFFFDCVVGYFGGVDMVCF